MIMVLGEPVIIKLVHKTTYPCAKKQNVQKNVKIGLVVWKWINQVNNSRIGTY